MRLNIIVARNARNVKTVMVFGFGQLLCGISWAVEGWQGRSDFFLGGGGFDAGWFDVGFRRG